MICPVPGNFKGPQKSNYLAQVLSAGKYQIRIPEHLKKHDKKENQETITKPFALHPSGDIFFAGHSFAHLPQPTQTVGSIFARIPFQISIAFLGQTLTQQPQATQSSVWTKAFRLFLIFPFTANLLIKIFPPFMNIKDSFVYQYSRKRKKFCDGVTVLRMDKDFYEGGLYREIFIAIFFRITYN